MRHSIRNCSSVDIRVFDIKGVKITESFSHGPRTLSQDNCDASVGRTASTSPHAGLSMNNREGKFMKNVHNTYEFVPNL